MASTHHARQPGDDDPLLSQYAHDPDMRELIEYFLDELAGRAEAIRAAFRAGQGEEVRHLAHQLQGAAGGYGFPTIGDCAQKIQVGLTAGEAELSALTEKVEDLITLCRRAAAGREATTGHQSRRGPSPAH